MESSECGIDGCSAPNYALSLKTLAAAYGKLVSGHILDGCESLDSVRIGRVMLEYPELISGEKRLDFELSSSFPKNLISKIGMESIEGLGFVKPNIGIAVKVHDGNIRALGVACVEIFKQLGLMELAESRSLLEKYSDCKTFNDRKIEAGKIVPVFDLKKT